jgi:hypothetical protein
MEFKQKAVHGKLKSRKLLHRIFIVLIQHFYVINA